MNTEDMAKEIMLKIFELTNKGINVEFEEDWGDGTITIYCGNNHTHCGYPDATDDELIKSIYETLVLGKGLSFDISLEEALKMEKHLFKIGDKYSKESIENIANSFNDTSITEEDNTLKIFVSGIEKNARGV